MSQSECFFRSRKLTGRPERNLHRTNTQMTRKLTGSAPWRPAAAVAAVLASLAMLMCWSAPAARAFAATEGVWLAPHRAVYDVTLENSRGPNGVAAVRGRMVFEFVGASCEGYTLNTRLVTETTNTSGDTTLIDLRWSTWEQGNGEQFRFNSIHYRDRAIAKLASGSATRATSAPGLIVKLTKPEAVKLRYPGSILFPTQHSLEILNAARKGSRILQAKVFDGSEQGRRVYETTAFISKRQPPGGWRKKLAHVANDEALDTLDSWPVTIGYFDSESEGEAKPAYETSFVLFANGVSRDIVIDYGDFAIRGSLKALKFLTPVKCE